MSEYQSDRAEYKSGGEPRIVSYENGMTLVAVAAEYKGDVGSIGEQRGDKSPFEAVWQMLEKRRQLKAANLGAVATKRI